ncbi:MAG TPA: UbiA family prenyltransferase, partial [Bacteroidales bacterium]|nr:UbiA family prenyltransferase [Bacteroidales bacterium]
MKKILSIVRIMRMPNLLIVVLTMFILRYGLIRPFLFSGQTGMMSGWLDFSLLVLSTVLITVAGYIINDSFDAGIDAINKPGKNRVGPDFSERSALYMYQILNGVALIVAVYLAFRLQSLTLGLLFPFIIYLVWLYSSKYKKSLIMGNLIVAFLSAMVIFMVWYFEFLHLRMSPEVFATVLPDMKNLNLFFIIYGLFAFL